MNVYVESNFVLELAFTQEEAKDCESLLSLAESKSIALVLPAFSLAEPYETLIRRQRDRARIRQDLDPQFRELTRAAAYAKRRDELAAISALLTESAETDAKELETVRARLIATCTVVPLDAEVMRHATKYGDTLSPLDAIVFASVVLHLTKAKAPASCFLNRNSRDFDDPDLVDELRKFNCSFFPSFTLGREFIASSLAKQSSARDQQSKS